MATWRKIVTENADGDVVLSTTAISLAGEVTAAAQNFDGTQDTLTLTTVVADHKIDTQNIHGDVLVVSDSYTGGDFTNTQANNDSSDWPDNDTTIATTKAIKNYVDSRGFGAGSGDMESVTIVAGTGLTGTNLTASSGAFNGTLNVIGGDGITANADEIEVTVDGTTIQLNNTDGTGAVSAVTAAIADGGTGLATADQIHTFVTAQTANFITDISTTIHPVSPVQVSLGDGTALGTSDVTFTNGDFLNIGVSGLSASDITNSFVHIGDTQVSLSNLAGSVTAYTGITSIQGDSTGFQVTELTSLDCTAENQTIYSSIGNNTITIGGSTSTTVIAGDLTVQGDTTTINTSEVLVEDKIITLANVASPTTTTADQAGIEIEAGDASSKFSTFKWHRAQGGGNTDGAGTADGLTGWKVANSQTSNQAEYAVAIMDFGSVAPTTQNSAGIGALFMDSTGGNLYVRTA